MFKKKNSKPKLNSKTIDIDNFRKNNVEKNFNEFFEKNQTNIEISVQKYDTTSGSKGFKEKL